MVQLTTFVMKIFFVIPPITNFNIMVLSYRRYRIRLMWSKHGIPFAHYQAPRASQISN